MSAEWRTVALVTEGQTEDAFAELLLAPLAHLRGIDLKRAVVTTKRTATRSHKGGGDWSHMRDVVQRWAHEQHWYRIGVMFDVYASKFARSSTATGYGLYGEVAQGAYDDLKAVCHAGDDRLVVGPVLHEFETLVMAAVATGKTSAHHDVVTAVRRAIAEHGGNVELINGSASTSPSHRLQEWWLDAEGTVYSKTLDGPLLIDQAGMDTVLAACPTFAQWVDALLPQ